MSWPYPAIQQHDLRDFAKVVLLLASLKMLA